MSALLFEVGTVLSRLAPAPLRYSAARLAGRLAFRLNPRLRRQALENYAGILHQPAEAPAVHSVAKEAVVGYAKLIADFLLLPSLGPDSIAEMVEWHGFDTVEKILALGKGAIVVTPHFGNWDLAASAAAARGVPLTAVTDVYGSGRLNARVVAARERVGMRVVPLDTSAGKAVLTALRRNQAVALVCDLAKEGRTVKVRVVGQQTMVPAGPALLALRSGAPVIPILCRRRPDNRYLLEVMPPIEFSPSGVLDDDVPALAQAIMDRFEPALRANPEQWYLFSPMWEPAPATAPDGIRAEPPVAAAGSDSSPAEVGVR